MPRIVRFEQFGGPEVLQVVEAEQPAPGEGTVLVRVRAAGLNPVESGIRGGFLDKVYPTSFPSQQGRDVAGVVEAAGPGVTAFAPGDEVLGWTDERGTQADYAVVPVANLTARPAGVPWEVAGALYTAGAAAWAAISAVAAGEGDTVVVANAAGGVGTIAVQLARIAGATVIGLAGEDHHEWLRGRGVVPVAYGEGVEERVREAAGDKIDAFVDAFGADYVDLALRLGVQPDRVNTLINFAAVAQHGVKASGSNDASRPEVLAELAGLVADGRLEVPVQAFPLELVAEAYTELERRHTLGKLVVTPAA
ncbi:NADP-dependent oxidoreductase [Dactylosporangium sp. NPDC051485]|uniref:NADP-dependent oxidoreductase n=1 Tax=Dactylosporangium sp. NPDC051485 TaxID=3154846 RepID=UPI00344632B3